VDPAVARCLGVRGDAQLVQQCLRLARGFASFVERNPRLRIEVNFGGGNFKAQFRRADKSGAPLALIVGEDELARGVVAMKPLREQSGQTECPVGELAPAVDAALALLAQAGSAPAG
jgi:histidyl-tRNA synthetase